MNTLYFIRHGQTESNVKGLICGQMDTELTQKGIEDAIKKATELDINFDYYYCSPLKRTQQTLYALKGDVPYFIDDRIIDINMGDWTGIRRSDIYDEVYNEYAKKKFTPPNAETANEVDNRIISFMKDLFDKYNDSNILVITHGIIIRYTKLLFTGQNVGTSNLEIFPVTENMFQEKFKL